MNGATDRLLRIDKGRLDMPLVESAGWHDIVRAIPSVSRQTRAFHVTYVARQEATWLIDNEQRLFIQAGQLALIPPHSLHQGAWAVDHPNQHFWFYFQTDAPDATRHTPFDAAWLQKVSSALHRSGPRVVKAPSGFDKLAADFLQRLPDAQEHDYLWLRSLIAQIFLATVEAFTEISTRAPSEMQEILRVVETRLLEWPQVAAVAEFFAMEPSQFQRLFKKATGMSPWNYILRARCRQGCEQLQRSSTSVTNIAHALGFSSSQHFSTVFRRLTGHTPLEFRRLHRAN